MSEKFTPIKDEPGLKCLECNYFGANIYLYENNTFYPNCGDQSCVSSFFWSHPIALAEMEKDLYSKVSGEPEPERPSAGVEL